MLRDSLTRSLTPVRLALASTAFTSFVMLAFERSAG
jgi:hypothetical protein